MGISAYPSYVNSMIVARSGEDKKLLCDAYRRSETSRDEPLLHSGIIRQVLDKLYRLFLVKVIDFMVRWNSVQPPNRSSGLLAACRT